MQTSNVKTTLAKLLSLGKRGDKIRAALPTSVVPGISESESGSQIEYVPSYRITKDYRMAQLKAEFQRAQAEEVARRIFRMLK